MLLGARDNSATNIASIQGARMRNTLQRALTGMVLATALAALSTTGVAHAQAMRVSDERGDVRSFDTETDEPTTHDPAVRNGDVLRSVLRHASRRISVRVKFVDLQRTGDLGGYVARVVTNEAVRRNITIIAGPGMWRGESDMTRPNGPSVRCSIKHRIDYTGNIVTLSFPRSCVSSPRWVRLGAASVWSNGSGGEYFVDDAQISGRIHPDTVRLSPRLRRG